LERKRKKKDMAGLINKIGDALHIGGGNKEGEHKNSFSVY
jgi:hypothetical protein